jgi:hypothetical protein
MRCLGRLIAVILAIIYITVLPCAMWSYNIQRIALNGDTYKNLFTDEGFYQDLIPAVIPAIIDGIDTQQSPGEMSLSDAINGIPYRDWERISRELDLVPPAWVKAEVEHNLDNTFGWLEGNRDDLVLIFNTQIVKDRLEQSGDLAVQRIVEQLPPCSEAENAQLYWYMTSQYHATFPYCQPQNPDLRADMTLRLVASKDRILAELPEQLDLLEHLDSTPGPDSDDVSGAQSPTGGYTRAELNDFRAFIRLWQRVIITIFLIPTSLLSMIVIVTVRSGKSFFRWMGCPIMLGSIVTLFPLIFLPLLVSSTSGQSEQDVAQGFAAGGQLVAEILVNGMARLVIAEFTMPVLIQSAILLMVGFIFMVLSVLLNEPADPQPQLVFASTPYPTQAYPTASAPITPTGSSPVTGSGPITPPPTNPPAGQ